ncbi:pilus assembly protein HofO [Kosakonia arachidis]|uniref:Pilus assembly protein HofO n=1 Tax=Kosakonia arachidis TaxID=551989 RepID=A0A1I7E074_9ENTR|nr:hypothetical protein [Kosakonia arachidis]SFU17317.1 pilus assembly protein HofO [Kosakonia arachidis]
MLPLNADFWFVLSPWQRTTCWLLSIFCGLLLVWWLTISPLNAAQEQLIIQQSGQQAALQAQWRTLRALFPPTENVSLPTVQPFSPLDFQETHSQLIRWQPGKNGGELVLESSWERVIETFVRLASCDIQVPAFSLAAGTDLLRFTLKLEHDNDH